MPLFDFDCPKCGLVEDVLVPNGPTTSDYPCPNCSFLSYKLLSVIHPSGILPSKPLEVNHAGLSLETNKDRRQYEKENPNSRFVDRESTYWKNKVERLHSRREVRVQKQGYRDFEEFKVEKRKESGAQNKPNA
jgi:hypothetical protein